MQEININKATATELQQIAGIGPVRAEKIIENRPFRDLYELSKIAGLGKKRMDAIINQDILIEIK
jgi:competence protein ComEA